MKSVYKIFLRTLGVMALAGWTLPLAAVRAPEVPLAQRADAAGGWRPSPTDFSHLAPAWRAHRQRTGTGPRLASVETPLPSAWDARDSGWVTPVRSQGSYGTCWTFATCAALETAFLRTSAVTNDFAENHLATHDVGFAWGYDDGGNNQIAAALLLAWRDPLDEADDPYANPDATVTLPPRCHVQNLVHLPSRTVTHTNDAASVRAANEILQRAIQTYGALCIGYTHSSSGFNEATGAHYYRKGMSKSGGHAVTLIGWDDAYPTNNFNADYRPPAAGAFLVKNSWGVSSGDGGYAWISYYDDGLCREVSAGYPQPEATNNYGRVYQYDPCGQIATWNVYTDAADQAKGGKTNWCANVFTSVATGIVEAVGFYALSYDTRYRIRVYAGCVGAPSSGTLLCEQAGTVAEPGYATIRLATAVPVAAAEKFAVAVNLETPDYDYPIPVECSSADYCTATSHAGESFLSGDGETWTDFKEFPSASGTENVCVKAYTRHGADGPVERLIAAAAPEAEGVTLRCGESCVFSVRALEEGSADACVFAWTLDDEPQAETSCADGVSSFAFTATAADHGSHRLVCRVSRDGAAEVRAWSVSVSGTVWVDADAAASEADGTEEHPFPTLVEALTDVVSNDVVWVRPGLYVGMVTVPSVPLEIRSTEGPDVTILEPGVGEWCCYDGYYNPNTQLTGFTLLGGSCQYGGGALYGTLSNCVITACEANYGGGVSDSILIHCVISNCVAYYGGGAFYSELWNCLLVGNVAYYHGGGAYECDLANCTVAGNRANYYGGGAYLNRGLAVNTIVATNVSASGSAYGNDVYGNGYWTMVCSSSDVDAKFADVAHGDYRLSLDSPCLNAGTNAYVIDAFDLDGRPRIVGRAVDQGAFERELVAEGWTDPQVTAADTPASESAKVAQALRTEGFPVATANAVGSLVNYAQLGAWASAKGISKADLAAAALPLLSAALGAEGLLDYRAEDVVVAALEQTGSGWRLRLPVPACASARAHASLLQAAVTLEQAAAPTGPFAAATDPVTVESGDAQVEVSVTPASAVSRAFYRLRLR